MTRNNIRADTAVLDGVYVAHQGMLAGYGTYWMMKYFKKYRKPPKVMDVMMRLMGLDEESYRMFDCIYWDVSLASMKRNLLENYTYRTNPKIAESITMYIYGVAARNPMR